MENFYMQQRRVPRKTLSCKDEPRAPFWTDLTWIITKSKSHITEVVFMLDVYADYLDQQFEKFVFDCGLVETSR